MGKKGGRSYQKKGLKNATTSSRNKRDAFSSDDMDDEIDAFHKQRDIVPFDINDAGESDEDEELPIFEDKDIDNDDEDDDDDDDDDEEDTDEDDDGNDDVAKMIRQKKYLREKFGGVEDEMHDDEEDEEDYKLTFGGKRFAHGAENRNFEIQSSDDEAPKEEEELALQIQREKAKSLTMEDYDLVDISEDKDTEKLALKDASNKGNRAIESLDRDITFKVEDLNALSKEEQMNVLYRSAPELVDWLSELNEAHKQLECKINPFLSKVKEREIVMEGGLRYFELKQLLLLSYCQAITFYLLLKSEGQPVHDHPVLDRLEEIKKLLDQIKQLDSKLPVELVDILEGSNGLETQVKSDNENAPPISVTKTHRQPRVPAELPEKAVPDKVVEMQNLESLNDGAQKARKVKHQKDHIGVQSLEMLKVRASLEEKLKQKGLYSSVAPNPISARKRSRPVNGQLETYDDFDDDAVDVKGKARLSNGPASNNVSQFLNANLKKPKVVSGDDDLPKRDDIGERRLKHELRVLAGAGVKTEDDDDDDDQMGELGSDEGSDEEDDVGSGDSENEFYKQVEQLRAAKLAAKVQTYSRNSAVPFVPEDTVEGKRLITSQMEKNRGLTRNRNKGKKNPRKNYKLKHQKAVKNRKGQVRAIQRPTAPYGGESTGINAAVSRSVRFKS